MLGIVRLILCGLTTFKLTQRTNGQAEVEKWQCSPSQNRSIIPSVSEDYIAFDVIENPPWLYESIKYINCSQKGLTRVPRGLESDIEILNLDQNSITKIYQNDFDSYPKLVAITMVNNCLKAEFYDDKIPRCQGYFTAEIGAFSSLKSLKFLALNGNVMKTLPRFPSSLAVLFISFSSLGPLNKNDFENLNSLEIAVFSTNCISGDIKHFCQGNFSIKTSLFPSSVLKFLDLSYNNLKHIPTYLFNQSLLGIKLRGNPFHILHYHSFNNSYKLKYLNLAWTSQYDQIPLHIEENALSMLTDLEILDLSGNMISRLPTNFLSDNSKLKSLNLAFNCLKTIETNPKVLPLLPVLDELYVSGNTFCKPDVIPLKPIEKKLTFGSAYLRFPNLTTLVLGTSINIPETKFIINASPHYYSWYGREYANIHQNSFDVLRNLTRFKRLALSFCGIRNIDTSAFVELNLSYLDLRFNFIKHISSVIENFDSLINTKQYGQFTPPKTKQLYNLKIATKQPIIEPVVYLSYNSISLSNMKSPDLKYLANTAFLDLSHNQIEFISNVTFQNFSRLQCLDLRYNPIRWIESGSFAFLPKLDEIKLYSTTHQSDIKFRFLEEIQNDLTLVYGETSSNIYHQLKLYANTSRKFLKVTKLDVSYVYVPIFYISNNLEIFSSFPNLQTLIMNGAQLTFPLQSHFFKGLYKLQTLYMSECWIEHFPDIALNKLTNLIYLDLSFNKIEILDSKKISNYTNLRVLILSYNFIHKITPKTLKLFVENGLKSISLNHNQLRQLDASIIDKKTLKLLSYLDLRGNTISCDCTMSRTFGWLIRSKHLLLNKSIPGFLPKCSDVLIDYYGGCLRCEAPKSVKPPSIFVYSLSNNCEEEFLIDLTSCFVSFIVLFTTTFLICSSKQFKRKLFVLLSRDIRIQMLKYEDSYHCKRKTVYAYDAFVFYDKSNTEVGDWVDDIIVPQLETSNQSFRICVVGKEDWCGTSQVKQLHFRIQASRKTIIVLSKGFSQTSQCRYVVSVLEELNYVKKENKCVIITYKETFSGGMLQFQHHRNPYSVLCYWPTITDDLIFHESLKTALIESYNYAH